MENICRWGKKQNNVRCKNKISENWNQLLIKLLLSEHDYNQDSDTNRHHQLNPMLFRYNEADLGRNRNKTKKHQPRKRRMFREIQQGKFRFQLVLHKY